MAQNTQVKCLFLYVYTFCATNISYAAQTPATVMPCSLQSIAVAMHNMENARYFQPAIKYSL